MRRLTEGCAAAFVLQVVAADDLEPPEHGNIHLIDSESGESLEMFIDSMVEQRHAATRSRSINRVGTTPPVGAPARAW